jgi:nicotinamidase-related amidase
MIGSVGHAIDPSLFEAMMFHAAARRAQPIFLSKGSIPQTEHYSVLEPEVKYAKHPQGGLNTGLLDALAKHDLVYVAGQAKSHCVLETLRSMVTYFEQEPAVLAKIRVLRDCTSSVAHPTIDFDGIAEAELARFAKKGLKQVTSLDPLGLGVVFGRRSPAFELALSRRRPPASRDANGHVRPVHQIKQIDQFARKRACS